MKLFFAYLAGLSLCLGLASAVRAGTLVAQPEAPSYAQLLSSPSQIRPAQGRPFCFILGEGEVSPACALTLEKLSLADRGLVSCVVGEWAYSFHHLKNGEEDGAGYKHYGGYPTPPQNRAEAMDIVRRYYLRLRNEMLLKATPAQRKLFVSINGHYCYQHYACAWGCDIVGSEVGENINSIQTHIAFTRGAARQYGKPWLMDFSSWFGPSIFDEDPHRIWGENSGPSSGHSLSLQLRTYYVSWMAGANVVVDEGGALNCFTSQQPGPDGMLPLSTLGREDARFYRFTRRHPDRGIPYSPVAVVLPFDHGIYPGFGAKLTWNIFPYTAGDQRILDTLNLLFPGSLGDPAQSERPDHQPANPTWKDSEYMHTEVLRLVTSSYGDIADVLLSNAEPEVLNSYPVLILAGDFIPEDALARRLDRYVEQGGTLILSEADEKKGILPASLAAHSPISPTGEYSRFRHGRGAVIVLSNPKTGQPMTARSLAKVLAPVRKELIPVDVSGAVETLYNRTPDGWIVTLVNNGGVTKTFREPAVIDPKAAQAVTLACHGRGKIYRAVLWGADTDEELAVSPVRVTIPPGEVRIIQLTLQP